MAQFIVIEALKLSLVLFSVKGFLAVEVGSQMRDSISVLRLTQYCRCIAWYWNRLIWQLMEIPRGLERVSLRQGKFCLFKSCNCIVEVFHFGFFNAEGNWTLRSIPCDCFTELLESLTRITQFFFHNTLQRYGLSVLSYAVLSTHTAIIRDQEAFDWEYSFNAGSTFSL